MMAHIPQPGDSFERDGYPLSANQVAALGTFHDNGRPVQRLTRYSDVAGLPVPARALEIDAHASAHFLILDTIERWKVNSGSQAFPSPLGLLCWCFSAIGPVGGGKVSEDFSRSWGEALRYVLSSKHWALVPRETTYPRCVGVESPRMRNKPPRGFRWHPEVDALFDRERAARHERQRWFLPLPEETQRTLFGRIIGGNADSLALETFPVVSSQQHKAQATPAAPAVASPQTRVMNRCQCCYAPGNGGAISYPVLRQRVAGGVIESRYLCLACDRRTAWHGDQHKAAVAWNTNQTGFPRIPESPQAARQAGPQRSTRP